MLHLCLLLSWRQAFCGFGGGSSGSSDAIDNFMFAKLIRECDLLSSRFTNTDVDIIFSQVRTPTPTELAGFPYSLVAFHRLHWSTGWWGKEDCGVGCHVPLFMGAP